MEKLNQTKTFSVEQKPYTINDLTEQPDFASAVRLLPKFNFKSIPDGFCYLKR